MLSNMLSSTYKEDCEGITSRREIICSCCDVIGHRVCDCKSILINNFEKEIINIIKRGDVTAVSLIFNSLWANNKSGLVFALCYPKQILVNDASYKTFKLVCKLLMNYYYIFYYMQTKANPCLCPVLLKNKSMYIFKNVSIRIIRQHNTNTYPMFLSSRPILIPFKNKK